MQHHLFVNAHFQLVETSLPLKKFPVSDITNSLHGFISYTNYVTLEKIKYKNWLWVIRLLSTACQYRNSK